jgi:ribosome-binding protein aMBF1 (putative translation factor)
VKSGKGRTKKRQKDIVMIGSPKPFPELVQQVCRQLGISQEELVLQLDISHATVNRWENSKTTPFKLAWAQFDVFCEKMMERSKLKLFGGHE